MRIEVSNGEAVDRWTILVIKGNRFKDNPAKMESNQKALETLSSDPQFIEVMRQLPPDLVDELLYVNNRLWDIEDRIREKENSKEYGKDFIQLARTVYIINDQRSELKRRINEITKSTLTEEKLYSEYK